MTIKQSRGFARSWCCPPDVMTLNWVINCCGRHNHLRTLTANANRRRGGGPGTFPGADNLEQNLLGGDREYRSEKSPIKRLLKRWTKATTNVAGTRACATADERMEEAFKKLS
jgi:hypothetical protein